MATTTNFGWETPDDTDLVKDGALAIRTLGNSIDTSLVDLKGGTTGQVLSKTSNTDMDFTWVTSDDANAIQNTIVDAKGDLIAASAADTPARLAVGNNGDTLLADSAATTGLRWTATPSASNPVINGGFDVWQRGTSISTSSAGYTADRWYAAAASAGTVSRQATSDTTNLPSIQYCLRFQRTNGSTSTTDFNINSSFETVNSIPYTGKTVTFSFYARAGANYSSASNALGARLWTGTGTDQAIYGTYTGSAFTINQTATLTTTWQRFTYSATIPTTTTEMALQFFCTPTGTAGAADYFEVTGVQIDVGSVALPFRRSGNTLAGERSLCERYYCRFDAGSTNYNPLSHVGQATATTTSNNTFQFPTTMRIAPTSVDGANLSVYGAGSGNTPGFAAVSAIALTRATVNMAELSSTSTGLTLGGIYRLQPNNAAGYVAFSAEL